MCMSIKGPRGCGKSTRLLEIANENNGIFVTGNTISARILAREQGFDNIKDIVDYHTYIHDLKHNMLSQDKYYLDDIEFLIKSIGNIDAYTSSTD